MDSRVKDLEQEGWTRQFLANEPRLSEAVQLYEETGFEVHLEPLPPSEETPECSQEGSVGECRECFKGFEDQYKIIFTRKKKGWTDPNDELF